MDIQATPELVRLLDAASVDAEARGARRLTPDDIVARAAAGGSFAGSFRANRLPLAGDLLLTLSRAGGDARRAGESRLTARRALEALGLEATGAAEVEQALHDAVARAQADGHVRAMLITVT